MRPTKLTPDLLDAFRAVLSDEWAVLAFTEEELVWQANRRLPGEDRISYRTYQRYKADILYLEEADDDGEERAADAEDEANTALVLQMHDTLKEALLAQKKALVRGVCEGLPNWRRYTWMLERKFPDFRLKALTEALGKPQPTEKTDQGTQKAKADLEAKKKWEATAAKMEAEKAEHLERMEKDMAYKWRNKTQPWKPRRGFGSYHTIYPEQLKALEEELARDVAAGYVDPYAHLGYRPDPVEQTKGHYLIMAMGEDRLPLRVHVLRTADAPTDDRLEALWQAQELERRNIARAEQGLPPEEVPGPPADSVDGPDIHSRTTIYGHSGM